VVREKIQTRKDTNIDKVTEIEHEVFPLHELKVIKSREQQERRDGGEPDVEPSRNIEEKVLASADIQNSGCKSHFVE
jgi:hypothetical protein